MTSACMNCASSLEPGFAFCPQCGQKTNLHRLSLHDVLHDGFHYFTHADKGFLMLLKALWQRNGLVAREYVSGRRKKYFPPLNFFLIVLTLYLLLTGWALPHRSYDVYKENPDLMQIRDTTQRNKTASFRERQHKAVVFLQKYSNTIGMVALPLICLFFWLPYRHSGYNYIEHLVACMYLIGFCNLFFAVVVALASIFLGFLAVMSSALFAGLFFVLQTAYASVFYYHFINDKSTKARVKAVLVSFFSFFLWFLFSAYLVSQYMFNGLWGLFL